MSRAKILFIEDDLDQVKIYDFKFKLEGLDFISTQHGAEGLRMAEAQKPDLILLDMLLFDKKGTDILKKLKENEHTQRIPVIIFTNFDKEETAKEALALGAVDYIIKSKITPSDIVKKVKEILHT
ncbi:MAG: response regulator [Patescibacteria group bacterium]|jgi:DNA-binding response OmpR family regulator